MQPNRKKLLSSLALPAFAAARSRRHEVCNEFVIGHPARTGGQAESLTSCERRIRITLKNK
jgi:hypothetical protein